MIDAVRLASRAAGRRQGKDAVALLQELAPPAGLEDLDVAAPPMTHNEARLFELQPMPFGLHQGKLMHQVPLKYLDWLVGAREQDMVAQARRYLARPDVAERLRKELNDGGD